MNPEHDKFKEFRRKRIEKPDDRYTHNLPIATGEELGSDVFINGQEGEAKTQAERQGQEGLSNEAQWLLGSLQFNVPKPRKKPAENK